MIDELPALSPPPDIREWSASGLCRGRLSSRIGQYSARLEEGTEKETEKIEKHRRRDRYDRETQRLRQTEEKIHERLRPERIRARRRPAGRAVSPANEGAVARPGGGREGRGGRWASRKTAGRLPSGSARARERAGVRVGPRRAPDSRGRTFGSLPPKEFGIRGPELRSPN